MAGVAVAGAGVLCSEGFVRVNVTEKAPQGGYINVIAPAMLAPLAVRLVPLVTRFADHAEPVSPDPTSAMTQAAAQLRQQLPVIDAALDSLRDAGDFTLVEVDASGEHVNVAKSGASIVVDVDDPAAVVHISAPIRALYRTIHQLACVTP
jgi:hypothetical protein